MRKGPDKANIESAAHEGQKNPAKWLLAVTLSSIATKYS